MKQYCSVVDPIDMQTPCEAPPAYGCGGGGVFYGTVKIRTKCSSCGEPVCKACSAVTGKKRLCRSCIRQGY